MNIKELIFELLAPKAKPAQYLISGVTLYGDSIMYGGVGKRIIDSGYTSVLRGNVLHDLSMPGDTAKNLWHRIPYSLRSTKYVVVQQGTNDISEGNNPVPYLKKIARYLKTEGRTVILTGVSHRTDLPDSVQLQYAVEIQKLAEQEKVLYVNWPVVTGKTTDGIHPDSEMTRKLADQIVRLI